MLFRKEKEREVLRRDKGQVRVDINIKYGSETRDTFLHWGVNC